MILIFKFIISFFLLSLTFVPMDIYAHYSEQEDAQLVFDYGGQEFVSSYTIFNAELLNAEIDPDYTSLIISVGHAGDGWIDILLPRQLLDAKFEMQDDEFIVLINGEEENFDEITANSTYRELLIYFARGTEEIEILGTQVIGEYNYQPTEQYSPPDQISDGESEFVVYDITNGEVLGLFVDPDFTSIIIQMRSHGYGSITLSLPRNIIDAKFGVQDDEFIVLIDGEEENYREFQTTNTHRSIEISFPRGSEEIEIIGTQVASIEPIPPSEVPEGQNSLGKFVLIFISNIADEEGCPEEDWEFAYQMGNLAWVYLAQYQIPANLQVMCQNIDDFNSYHPTGFITGILLDEGQSVPDEGIRYDRDQLTTVIDEEEVPILGVAMWDETNGERFYVQTYTVYDNEYYDINPEQTAWTISHEVSHIALRLLGYPEDIYSDWVHEEQERCDLEECEVERIFVSGFVWYDVNGIWYDVMKHYD